MGPVTGLVGPLAYAVTALGDPLTGGPRRLDDLVVTSSTSTVTSRSTVRPDGTVAPDGTRTPDDPVRPPRRLSPAVRRAPYRPTPATGVSR